MKQIKSIILTLLTALLSLPATAQDFEYEGLWYTVLDPDAGTCKTKNGDQSQPGNPFEGDLVIPQIVSFGDNHYTVTEIGAYSFILCHDMTSIRLPETIESIHEGAFWGCGNVKSMNIPQSLRFIGNNSLTEMGLVSVVLPEGLKVIEHYAFWGDRDLESVVIPASVEEIGVCSFHHTNSLKSVTYLASEPRAFDGGIFDTNDYESNAYKDGTLYMPNATLASIQAVEPWSRFKNIVAKDGEIPHHFEYEGLWYTVLDPDAGTCQTKEGPAEDQPGNIYEGALVIPDKVYDGESEYTVVAIGERGFFGCEGISSVELPNSITVIGDAAFWGCANMRSFKMSQSLQSIGSNAVRGCRQLTEVNLPESLLTIGGWAFSFCDRLESINLPESLTLLGDAAFSDCDALKSIVIPPSITRIGDMTFHSCNSLSSISIHDRLEVIGGYAFAYCPITEMDFPNSLTTIGMYAFCATGISRVDIPESVKYIGGNAFCWCGNLTEIHLPASLEEIGSEAFGWNDVISSIRYDAVSPLRTDEALFSERVYQRGVLTMPNAVLADVQATECWNQFYHIVAKDGEVQITPPLFAGDDFEYEGIWYTVLDPEAKTVKTRDGSDRDNPGNHFEGDLIIPSSVSINNSEYSVVEIGHHGFSSLPGLTSLMLPITVRKLSEAAFENCENLTSIILPDSLTEVERWVFIDCVSLTSVVLPEGLEYVGESMFAHCHSLTSATLPTTIKEIRGWAFGDANLTSINLPEGLETIGGEALTQNRNLASITFPSTLTAIWDRAFSTCAFTSLILPESLQILGDGAFYHCYELESIVLPASLNSMGRDVFGEGDGKLFYVTYNAEVPISADPSIFANSRDDFYETATLTMPNATLADIQAVTPWNLFQHIVAKDGEIIPSLKGGEDFEYEGIWYTVIDPDAKTVRTKAGSYNSVPGNTVTGDLIIPSTVSDGNDEYTVTELGEWGFFRNTDLTSIQLPVSLVSLGAEGAFYGCSELTSIEIPSSITEIPGSTFDSCTKLVSVKFPENLEVIRGLAFSYCESLSSLEFPSTLTTIESFQTFGNCYSLTEVVFPESMEYIGEDAFLQCYNLTSVKFPESLKFIGRHAFYVTGLTSVRIPASVETIEGGAFIGSDNIESVTYPAASPITAEADIFSETVYSNATLNTPNATVATVQATTPWSLFRHINAADGSIGFVSSGDDFEYDGIWYTVIDPDAKTVRTKEHATTHISGYKLEGDLNIPAYVVYEEEMYTVVEIGFESFALSDISSVSLPNTVLEIGDRAFYFCENLNNVTLPASLIRIGDFPFVGCFSIMEVNYMASIPIECENDVFLWDVYDKATLNAPNATLADIKATTPWNKFRLIRASDGSSGFVSSGDDFEYDGIWYTVIDPDSKTAKTKDGGNAHAAGDIVIPETVSDGNEAYTVVAVGEESFRGAENLNSVTLPAMLSTVGRNAFADCERLTSLIWRRDEQLNERVVAEIANPNLLLYVNDAQYAPEAMTANVVAAGVCESLVLTPGHAFAPATPFTALRSSMTKEFTQLTPIGGTAGWETVVLPFDVHSVYAENLRSELIPFASLTDIYAERPYWLYQADPQGEWKQSVGIQAGIPYLISTPNNSGYRPYYNVDGPVTFSSDRAQRITPETTAPYAVTWTSGREFRSLWLPLTEAEASEAMGLNANVSGLTDDDGLPLAPGSAFHIDVTPEPLEAYVTRLGAERAMRIMGRQSGVLPVLSDTGLDIRVEDGVIHAVSATDRTLHVFTPEGILVRTADLKAGEETAIKGLTPGIYLIAGRKLALH